MSTRRPAPRAKKKAAKRAPGSKRPRKRAGKTRAAKKSRSRKTRPAAKAPREQKAGPPGSRRWLGISLPRRVRRTMVYVGLIGIAYLIGMKIIATRVGQQLREHTELPLTVGWVSNPFGFTPTLRAVRWTPHDWPGCEIHIGALEASCHHRPAFSESPGLHTIRCRRLEVTWDLSASEPAHPEPAVDAPLLPESSAPDDLATAASSADQAAQLPPTVWLEDSAVKVRWGTAEGRAEIAIHGISARLTLRPDGRYQIHDLEGRIAGGNLRGDGFLAMPGEASVAGVQLRFNHARLEQLISGSAASSLPMEGALAGFASLRWGDSAAPGLAGAGWLEAARSDVWDLPPFAVMLNLLGLEQDDGDALRSARARWHLEGDRWVFEELIALGTPVSLYGHGTIDLAEGTLQAGFVPRFGSGLLSDLPIVGEATQLLLEVLKGTLFELVVDGPLANPRVEQRPLPIVTSPIRGFIDLFNRDDGR